MVRAHIFRPAHLGALALALATMGCGYARDPSAMDATAQAVAGVDVRLHGTWTLAAFTPETPLEPMLGMLLEAQFGNMLVRFDGRRLAADSPGIHVDRAYVIHDVYGDRFKLTAYDAQGIAYETECMFVRDDRLEIRSETSPWRGIAAIVRSGPAAVDTIPPMPREVAR